MNKEVQNEFNKVGAEFSNVYTRFDAVDKRFDNLETAVSHLHVLFEDQMSKLQAIAENFGTLELFRQRLVDHDERITKLENTRPVIISP